MKKRLFTLIFMLCLVCTGLTASPALAEQAQADIAELTTIARTAANTLLDELYDNYFSYYTAEELRLLTEDYVGTFGGIGITMTNTTDNNIVIYSVLANGPAVDTEIQAGDIIVAVDGQNMLGCDSNDAVLLIRGEIGTSVTLTLRHADSEELFEVTLIRQEITTTSVTAEIIEEVPNTVYFHISEFTNQTLSEFVTLYNQFTEEMTVHNIIFDLRSNGGGTFSAAINLGNYFVPFGNVIVSEKTSSGLKTYESNSGVLAHLNVYILQNEWSASSSEVLAGALKDEAGAIIFGSTSYGKGITQNVTSTRSGHGLRYTRSRYYTPSGYDLHGVGILPDYEVELPEDITSAEYFSTDPQENPHLKAVVDYIQTH